MLDKKVKHYIKALLDFAKAKNIESIIEEDIKKLQKFYNSRVFDKKTAKVFDRVFHIISYKKQRELLTNLSKDLNLHRSTSNFINLLLVSKDIYLLKDILNNWQDIYFLHKGYQKIEVITAVELEKEEEDLLHQKLNPHYEKYYLSKKVDKNIIGGMILKVSSKTYDDSIRGKIIKIQNS